MERWGLKIAHSLGVTLEATVGTESGLRKRARLPSEETNCREQGIGNNFLL